jgi:hypothetical protein
LEIGDTAGWETCGTVEAAAANDSGFIPDLIAIRSSQRFDHLFDDADA